ncbi:MAG: acyl-CoA synthetase [Porticoccaceae bacterium]|nr:MAG: acyl-CoA synthetase [Porticoccaceae bacterium]
MFCSIRPPHLVSGEALYDHNQSLGWAQFETAVRGLVTLLREEWRLGPGDHLALLAGNRVEYPVAFLAGMLAGAWVTPVNTHLAAPEIAHILADSGARLVLCDREHRHLLPSGEKRFTADLSEVVASALRAPPAHISPGDPAGGPMLYTSGTTGVPKGVKRAKPAEVGAMFTRMREFGRLLGLDGRGPHLVTGPLYHAAPGLFSLYDLLNGAPLVILPKWDVEAFARSVGEFGVRRTHLVPTQFVRLLEARESGRLSGELPGTLSHVLHGAAPVAPTIKKQMIQWWGRILTEYWGGTESGVITLCNSEEWLARPGTVGRPLPDYEVFVGDERGLPSGLSEGPLYCRHRRLSQVFSYHNDPEKTRRAHPRPHVFSLGDVGRVDEAGFVFLADRQSHVILSGGVNVYPAEVERALLEHPAVRDATVFGIPDPEWGEQVAAVVEPNVRATEGLDDALRAFLRTRIASFKVPRQIGFASPLPRQPTGKIRTADLLRYLHREHRDKRRY